MANNHSTLTGLFTDIADTIREKTGGTEPIAADAFPEAISMIETGGGTDVEDALVTRTLTEYSNDRVTSIGAYAFYSYNYKSLVSVNFPNVTSIGDSAFTDCKYLTNVNFPVVTSIGLYAFRGCVSITSASFTEVTSLGIGAFSGCISLTSVSFPAVTQLFASTFYNCTALNSVYCPAVINIQQYAFNRCLSLTSVSFPLVSQIGNYAFYRCSGLATASFPAVTSIGSSAFYSCIGLVSLYMLGSSMASLGSKNAFFYTPMDDSTYTGNFGSIYVPASLVSEYQAASNWSYYADRITAIEE